MGENALQARNAASVVLKEYSRELARLKDKNNPNMRVMQMKYEKLIDAKEDLLKKHIAYGERAKKDMASAGMVDWITPLMDNASDLIDEVFILLDAEEQRLKAHHTDEQKRLQKQFEEVKLNNDKIIMKKQAETEQKVIEDAIGSMAQVVEDPLKNSEEDALLVQAQVNELEMFLESQTKSWNNLKELFADDANEMNNIAATESSIRTRIANARSKATAFIKGITPPDANDDASSVSSRRSTSTSSDHSSSALRLKKVGLPSFSGDVREYAHFKGNFLKVVQPHYPEEANLVYVMKQECVKGEVKTLIDNIETMKDIWERLDDRYGHEIDIVNMVLNDVKNLTINSKDQQQGLVNLVNTVEKGMQDLINIKALGEMANAYTVSLIEKKLPMRILSKWMDNDTSKVGAERFDELVEFLKIERKHAQRLIQLRSSDEKTPPSPKDNKDNNRRANGGHHHSNAVRHGNGGGGGGNDGSGGHKINPNNSCLIHPNSNHLTRDCREFRSKTAAERGQLVKDQNGCRLCLSKSHVGKVCPFEQKWQPCNINGCQHKHNRLVHDSGVVGISCHVQIQQIKYNQTTDPGVPNQQETPPQPTSSEAPVACETSHITSAITVTPETPHVTSETPHITSETPHVTPETPHVTSETTVTPQSHVTTYRYDNNHTTLLLIQEINTTNGKLKAFWDDGSTLTLVSRSFIKRMKLKGVPISYSLKTVGGVVTWHNSTLYELTLYDTNGDMHVIQAFEIEDICGNMESYDASSIMHLFPGYKAEDIMRRGGEVDLLIGNDYAALHPVKIASAEGLVMYDSKFGSGKVLGGCHHTVQQQTQFTCFAHHMSRANVSNVRISHLNPGIDCFTADDLGIKIPPRCNRCQNCTECRFEAHQLSRIEQKELDTIRNNLQLDPVHHYFTTTYPYKEDPRILQDNRDQVMGMLYKLEKRLARSDVNARKYCEQFDDFIKRGVISEISQQEMNNYDGPVYYVSHHEVFKDDSSSTPMRIVVNPSLRYKGVGLNDILMKGPNCLQDLFGIQLRFRQHAFVLVCDIAKFYHSVHTTATEKHLRRILFRHMNTDQPVKTYGFERVTFGDRPAGAICTAALHKTADTYNHIDQDAALKIKEDSFCDDIVTGDDDEARRDSLQKAIPEILGKGNFSIKGFVINGDRSSEARALLGTGEMGRVLGVSWDPGEDAFCVNVRINISKKVKGARSQPDLTYAQIPTMLTERITMRILLGIVNSCYDVYGLLGPIVIQLKIELRKLFNKELKLTWDTPLDPVIKQRWIEKLLLLKEAEKIRFPRHIKPEGAVGDPLLVMSNDASQDALCCTAHVRWELENGKFGCSLLAAKSRVAPLKKQSIPHLEMQSGMMSTRLEKAIKHHMSLKFQDTVFILDSMCTLASLHKDTVALREYMANRVTECLETSRADQWEHTASANNIADLATRCDATVADISPESDWQLGPQWMRLPRDQWPTTQDFTGAKIPDEDLVKVVHFSCAAVGEALLDMERFRGRSYQLLMRVVALLLKMAKLKSFRVMALTAEDLLAAESYCLKLSMRYTQKDVQDGKLKSLRPTVDEDGVIVLNSRASEGIKLHYGTDRLPILAYRDPMSEIWMKAVHDEDHTGISRTVAKSRAKFWIVRARRLAERVRSSCYRCRILDKKLAEQQMAPLPLSRLAISPPFHVTSMDLFGPLEIKDMVKQRTRRKVWGVIFDCAATRAVYLDLTEDYGTSSILHTIRRFISLRGCPSEMMSDQGSQLIAASKDIANLVKDWDWEPVHTWASNQRMKWTVVPAEGQHQNGLSESLIKSVKRTLQHKIGPHVLNFSELQTIFFEVANIVNSRPIGVVSGSDPSDPRPLTPNDLLLGRASNAVPQGPFDSGKSITKRFRFVQQLVDEWWDAWYRTVLPTLVPAYKWLQRHRSVQIGDVCLIRYGKDKRATYRLGRVSEVKKSADNLVRKVTLKYKLPGSQSFKTVERPIQGIAVIVPVEEQHATETIETEPEKGRGVTPNTKPTLNPNALDFYPSL